jgi:hypothetical protein
MKTRSAAEMRQTISPVIMSSIRVLSEADLTALEDQLRPDVVCAIDIISALPSEPLNSELAALAAPVLSVMTIATEQSLLYIDFLAAGDLAGRTISALLQSHCILSGFQLGDRLRELARVLPHLSALADPQAFLCDLHDIDPNETSLRSLCEAQQADCLPPEDDLFAPSADWAVRPLPLQLVDALASRTLAILATATMFVQAEPDYITAMTPPIPDALPHAISPFHWRSLSDNSDAAGLLLDDLLAVPEAGSPAVVAAFLTAAEVLSRLPMAVRNLTRLAAGCANPAVSRHIEKLIATIPAKSPPPATNASNAAEAPAFPPAEHSPSTPPAAAAPMLPASVRPACLAATEATEPPFLAVSGAQLLRAADMFEGLSPHSSEVAARLAAEDSNPLVPLYAALSPFVTLIAPAEQREHPAAVAFVHDAVVPLLSALSSPTPAGTKRAAPALPAEITRVVASFLTIFSPSPATRGDHAGDINASERARVDRDSSQLVSQIASWTVDQPINRLRSLISHCRGLQLTGADLDVIATAVETAGRGCRGANATRALFSLYDTCSEFSKSLDNPEPFVSRILAIVKETSGRRAAAPVPRFEGPLAKALEKAGITDRLAGALGVVELEECCRELSHASGLENWRLDDIVLADFESLHPDIRRVVDQCEMHLTRHRPARRSGRFDGIIASLNALVRLPQLERDQSRATAVLYRAVAGCKDLSPSQRARLRRNLAGFLFPPTLVDHTSPEASVAVAHYVHKLGTNLSLIEGDFLADCLVAAVGESAPSEAAESAAEALLRSGRVNVHLDDLEQISRGRMLLRQRRRPAARR